MSTPTASTSTAAPLRNNGLNAPQDMQAEGRKLPGSPSSDSINSGMSVSSVVPVAVTPVDFKTLQGSYAGDHRANGAQPTLPSQPGPRDTTGSTGA